MVKNYIIVGLPATIPTLLTAQKYDHLWPFGYGENLSLQFGISILDFNLGQVSVGSFAQKNVRIGNYGSFICDKEGNLMLLTNNCAVFDRNFEVIDGSEVLTPGMLFDSHCEEYGYYPSYQSALFISAIDNDSIIFILHKDSEVSEALQDILSKHLYLSIIIKRPNGTFYLKKKDPACYQFSNQSPNGLYKCRRYQVAGVGRGLQLQYLP